MDDIWDYIVSDLQNRSAAERVIDRIMDAVDQLKNFAEMEPHYPLLQTSVRTIVFLSAAVIWCFKPLCKSAYRYASYWYPAQDRPLSNTIYNAGYDIDRVDLAAGIVYLTKAA